MLMAARQWPRKIRYGNTATGNTLMAVARANSDPANQDRPEQPPKPASIIASSTRLGVRERSSRKRKRWLQTRQRREPRASNFSEPVIALKAGGRPPSSRIQNRGRDKRDLAEVTRYREQNGGGRRIDKIDDPIHRLIQRPALEPCCPASTKARSPWPTAHPYLRNKDVNRQKDAGQQKQDIDWMPPGWPSECPHHASIAIGAADYRARCARWSGQSIRRATRLPICRDWPQHRQRPYWSPSASRSVR